jgi:hypothetical protein
MNHSPCCGVRLYMLLRFAVFANAPYRADAFDHLLAESAADELYLWIVTWVDGRSDPKASIGRLTRRALGDLLVSIILRRGVLR